MKDFIWTDDLVKEYLRWIKGRTLPTYDPLSEFKELHQPKKYYEILEFKHKEQKYCLWYDGKYHRINSEYYNVSLSHIPEDAKIISVKRISDGEVFSVGDEVKWLMEGWDKNGFLIESFQINNAYPEEERIFCNNRNICIEYLTNTKNKSSFTTEQQNEIISIVKK